MKKILLGTSALAFAGTGATGANAAEWDLDWGGFFAAYAVYADEDNNDNTDGFDILTDAEIIFTPTITLDNGLQFGANVQLEATNELTTDRVDESYLFVSGSFGELRLGADDSPYGDVQSASPDVFAGTYSGTLTGTFLPSGYSSIGIANQLAGDAVRITYYTPRFAGFQIGVSYARSTSKDDRFFEPDDEDLTDIVSIGGNYTGSFGSASLRVGAAYEQGDRNGSVGSNGVFVGAGGNIVTGATAPAGSLGTIVEPVAASADGDPSRYAVSAQVGFGGFTVGGGYAHHDDDPSETDFFNLGVAYGTGPWTVALSGSVTDPDGGGETTAISLNGQYNLGPGVNARAFVGYAEQDDTDLEGFAVGTGIALSF